MRGIAGGPMEKRGRGVTNCDLRLLSVDLLAQEASLVSEFREKSRQLGLGVGWHYLLDLSWAAHALRPKAGMWVLDAGGGVGLMQWWLADRGVDVLSVDREQRRELALKLRTRHSVAGWREGDLDPLPTLGWHNLLPPRSPLRWHRYPQKLKDCWALARARRGQAPRSGTVYISRQDLSALRYVDDESMDVVVSISALEHNSLEDLPKCVSELLRVLKPGGRLIATVGAAKERDWFHEPSKGWCLTEPTLRRVFSLPDGCPTNFADYDAILEGVRACDALRVNLDRRYFLSGDNGMPWGIWDPKYLPVGIMRAK
jgi:SAM-dependent methyltransferase